MKTSEAAVVLAKIAAIDNRTIGEAAALAWAEALDERMSLADALEAVRRHRATSTEYIQPAHVNAIAIKIRKDRLSAAGTPPIPGGLTYDREQAWRREYHDRIRQGVDRETAIEAANRALGVVEIQAAEHPVIELVDAQADRWRAR